MMPEDQIMISELPQYDNDPHMKLSFGLDCHKMTYIENEKDVEKEFVDICAAIQNQYV
jgi:hypothetical protein